TAAGLLVTKSGASGSADKALFGQLGGYPLALGISSFLMVALSLLPGIRMIPFMGIAAATGYAAYRISRTRRDAAAAQEAAVDAAVPAPVAEEPISTALQIDEVRLELGYALLALVSGERGHRLTDQIKGLRRQLASEMGFVLPSVRIQDNMQLPANSYVLRIKEIEAGRGDLRPAMLLVMDPHGQPIPLPGEDTNEPTFGLPARWINEADREEAQFRGLTVVDPPTVVTTHLTEVIRDNMAELLSYAETQKLLDELGPAHQKLVGDVIPNQISVGGLQRILQNLLQERVSARDLPTILEGISEACTFTRNITLITEHVRTRLGRQISDSLASPEGTLPLVTLSVTWEQAFAESLIGDGEEKQLAMAPSKLQEFIRSVREGFDRFAAMGEVPVLLTSPGIRPYVRSIVERFRPATAVLSQNEIHARARIKTVRQI
ncbi:MAG TPA: FHIPEP family type III secretion protein, partial [Solirubrobacterales bacterium]|nr:FHIPEP family type III secretion protein [Solirubrobacterales bacterium]